MKTNKTKNNLTENADEIRQKTMQILAGDQFTSALPYAQQWTKLCPRESMSWTALSIALYGLNRHAEARKALDKAILVNSTDWLSLSRMAGIASFLKYRLPEAEQLIRSALRLQPDAQTNWYVLGRILNEQGKYIEAMLCLSRAAEINENPSMSELCRDMIFEIGITDYSRN
jgi:tetratricopeptide (TPR) repeat protein